MPVILAGLLSGLVSPPADLLVAPDARLIALRAPAYLQSRPGASRFVLDAWQQYWTHAPAEPVSGERCGRPGPLHRRWLPGGAGSVRRCCWCVASDPRIAPAWRW